MKMEAESKGVIILRVETENRGEKLKKLIKLPEFTSKLPKSQPRLDFR